MVKIILADSSFFLKRISLVKLPQSTRVVKNLAQADFIKKPVFLGAKWGIWDL